MKSITTFFEFIKLEWRYLIYFILFQLKNNFLWVSVKLPPTEDLRIGPYVPLLLGQHLIHVLLSLDHGSSSLWCLHTNCLVYCLFVYLFIYFFHCWNYGCWWLHLCVWALWSGDLWFGYLESGSFFRHLYLICFRLEWLSMDK